MDPSLAAKWKVPSDKEIRRVREKQWSMQATMLRGEVVWRKDQKVIVYVEGFRTVYVGAKPMPEEVVHAEITLVPWLEAGYPTGLKIVGVNNMQPTFRDDE
jgi:hypothetical protein